MLEETISANGDAHERKSGRVRTAWKRSSPGLAAIAVFSIFINLLKLATPIYVLQLLDRVVASRSLETLLMLSVITLAAIVCGALLEATRRKLFANWGNWIERYFGPALFTSGMQREDGKPPASSTKLRDVATLRSFVSSQSLIAWLDLPWAPLFIVCVFLISPTLGYLVLVGSLLALTMGALNEYLTRNARNATRRAGDDVRDWVYNAERERETVGSLNTASSFARKWSDSAIIRQDEHLRSRSVHINFAVGMRMVGQFVRIGMLGVGIWLVINDTLSLGAVIAANILGRIAYALVQNAMVRWRDVVKASRAYARVRNSLEDEQAPVLSRASSTEPVPLTFKRVSYRYPGQPRSLLQRIELKIKPGELLCVIGSSARGKSTFCRLASGVVTPGAGSVRLGDVDVHRLQKNSLRREIGFLPQDITMFQGTIRQNIASMDDGDIDQIVDVAKLVGIHDAIINLPQGYDTVIEDREPLLSAGQRKCIALARAFYGSPALVILDEPFPHLDYHTRKALVRGINSQLEQGVIVILTSQRKSAARMADQAILLSERKYTLLASKAEINRYFEEREAGRSKRKARGQGKRSSRQKSEAEETDLNDAVIRPRFGHD